MPPAQRRTHDHVRAWSRRRWQAWIVNLISWFANYQGPGHSPSVREELIVDGDVGVILSVLYIALDEMDLGQSYGAPPQGIYFRDLEAELETVEQHVASRGGSIGIAHSPAELDRLIVAGTPALIHAVEGAFHLGDSEAEVRAHVARLAQLGVAYVTIAHLFWRQVATNAPALPFLPDWLYKRVFPEPDEGLTALGRAAVEAMVDRGVLVDLTHMSPRALKETFDLLDRLDPGSGVPLIATHIGCRFGNHEFCFTDETIREVARRGGVMGCNFSKHWMTDGLPGRVRGFDDSVEVLYKHIDRIRDLTGSFDHVAVGSDLDGYIKPALPGLEHMGRMADLQRALRKRYGPADAEKICSANALRALKAGWRGGSAP